MSCRECRSFSCSSKLEHCPCACHGRANNTNMNFLPPEAINPELVTLCPPLNEAGAMVTFNEKRYYLRRLILWDKEVICIKRIKKG